MASACFAAWASASFNFCCWVISVCCYDYAVVYSITYSWTSDCISSLSLGLDYYFLCLIFLANCKVFRTTSFGESFSSDLSFGADSFLAGAAGKMVSAFGANSGFIDSDFCYYWASLACLMASMVISSNDFFYLLPYYGFSYYFGLSNLRSLVFWVPWPLKRLCKLLFFWNDWSSFSRASPVT